MSKRVDATITCPQCGKQYPVKLYRTIWGEYEENRDLVMNNQINVTECPYCGFSFKAPYPFMYVDIKANFAVWWEPQHDLGVDSDTEGFARMFGERSFYATAPRVQDWDEFKRTINRYYSGELVGGPVEKMNFGIVSPQKSGCLGVLLIVIVLLSVSFISCNGSKNHSQNEGIAVENLDIVDLDDSIVKEILATPEYMSQLLENANNGNANAQYVLATCYYNGWEMPQNYKKAAMWYKKAAEQGHARGQSFLGECYMQGLGVPKDEKKAIKLFESSASQGCPEGIGNLGQAYFLGAGVETDLEKSVLLMEKAAKQGLDIYYGLLGSAYYQLKNYSKAVEYLQLAAEQGDGEAQKMLGDCYYYGIGVEQNEKTAEIWYNKAKEQGEDVYSSDADVHLEEDVVYEVDELLK